MFWFTQEKLIKKEDSKGVCIIDVCVEVTTTLEIILIFVLF